MGGREGLCKGYVEWGRYCGGEGSKSAGSAQRSDASGQFSLD